MTKSCNYFHDFGQVKRELLHNNLYNLMKEKGCPKQYHSGQPLVMGQKWLLHHHLVTIDNVKTSFRTGHTLSLQVVIDTVGYSLLHLIDGIGVIVD